MPTNHKTYNERLSYKQMITDIIDELEQVFSDSLCINHEESDFYVLTFKIENRNKKNVLTIYSSIDKMMKEFGTVSFSVKSKSKENKQIVISTFLEKGSERFNKTIFIGPADKNSTKIYLVDVESRFSNLSLSKLNTKLFTPFGRKLHANDNVKAPFKMVNMDFYIVDENNQTIQNGCDNEPCHTNYSIYARPTFIIAERAIFYQGHLYVKGELKKSHKRTTNEKIPLSNSTKWRRIVRYGSESQTRCADWIVTTET